MTFRRSLAALAVALSFAVSVGAQEQNPRRDRRAAPRQPSQQQSQPAAKPVEQAAAASQQREDDDLKGMQWRLVGPFRGGRVLAVSGVVGDPLTYYFGGVGGGVWKTTDGGLNWTPIADKDRIVSVGSIAVAESDPNVIYVGSGEACIRGNILQGDGVYKSTDAGRTWQFIGLRETRHIGKVAVHPKNPDVALVAALGHAYGNNAERGLFRTTDGGKSWQKVLYVDDKTGGIDVVYDSTNPTVLFAAMWQASRSPWSMNSGGPGSGLYRSGDGGATWKRLEGNGLPSGTLGRIGVAVSPANPARVWALIEAEKGGLFRSDDGGEKWQLINEDRNFRQRAWYYTHVYADPKNPEGVYILNVGMHRSTDGGRTFRPIRAPHGDHHGLWIDPQNPRRMINANDGGANVSTNGGETWTAQDNQPTSQFYRVAVDNQFPYFIYGAQQDNSTVAIASRTDQFGIGRADWYPVGGCESGYIAPHPKDPNIVYAGCYGGHITRFDKRTGQEQEINAWPWNPLGAGAAELKYRFQWTAPIVISPHDPTVLYHTAQHVLMSTDEGRTWKEISPDLTRNDKSKQQSSGGSITKDNTSVEYYNTIFTFVESPHEKGVMWAGSDDGLIHISRDGGQKWHNITPRDMPEWGRVSLIELSPHDKGTAYASVNRHELDDQAPYIFRTNDYGATWRRIESNLPVGAFVRAVREDPVRKGLLFAGTERGVYFSLDDGGTWHSLQMNLPVTSIRDLVIKNSDVVVATHGRSFWVLDDIGPLRAMKARNVQDAVTLFSPSVAYRMQIGPSPRGGNVGQNPPAGAIIYYYLREGARPAPGAQAAQGQAQQAQPGQSTPPTSFPEGKETPATATPPGATTTSATAPAKPAAEEPKRKITLEILDASGKVIRKYPRDEQPGDQPPGGDSEFGPPRPAQLTAEKGMNRFVWDLRHEPATRIPGAVMWGGSGAGPRVLPGKYQVRLTVDGQSQVAPLEVRMDPRITTPAQDLARQHELLMQIRNKVDQVHETVNQIRDVRRQVNDLTKRLTKHASSKQIEAAGKELDKKMTAVEEQLINTRWKAGQDPLNWPLKLNNLLTSLGGVVDSADAHPTSQSFQVFEELSRRANEQLQAWQNIRNTDLKAFNDLVRKSDVPAVYVAAEAAAAASSGGGE